MLRVLRHPPMASSRRLLALDCLTGEERIMGQDVDWDAKITSDDEDSTLRPEESEISSLVSDEGEQQPI